ncbi:hypothetical protein DL765_005172 [Monosporascus sp. GIB2]|nr:hypothetical protein DL765_005172 [Monosporascus sp. GIB2]
MAEVDIAEILAALPPGERERYLNGPAHPAPNGTVPNFDRPDNRDSLAISVLTVGLVLASIFILLRAYARIFCVKKVFLEDGLIIAGFGLFVAYDWCCYRWISTVSIFVHQWNVRLSEMSGFLYIVYIATNFYGSCVMVLKAAILYEWARIFVPRGTKNSFYWTCHILLWGNVLFYGSSKIASNLACFPHEKIWDKTIPGGHCLNERLLIVVVTVINAVSDLIILVLPQRVIWNLQMSLPKKLATSLVFAVGLFCFIASVFRVVSSTRYLYSTDITYDASAVALWAHVEMTTMFMVACVPSIPKALRGMGVHALFATLKTWATSARSTALSANRGATWMDQKEDTQSPYRQIEEHSLAPLTNDGKTEHLHDRNWADISHEGILRTTQVTTNTEEDLSGAAGSNYHRQHPWVTDTQRDNRSSSWTRH